MKKLLLLFVVCFLTANLARSQTIPANLEGFTLSVALKVQDVVSATNISEQKQVLLANFFKREGETILAAQNNNLSGKDLLALSAGFKTEFQSLLSAQELAAYTLKRPAYEYAKVTFSNGTH
jgi:hypothetical protein